MRITPINQNNNQKSNNTAFKSVRIYRDIYPHRNKMGIFVLNDDNRGLVQLTGLISGKDLVLGHSKDAITLEGMLENLGASIKQKENMAQVRELMQRIRERFKPELEGWFEIPGETMKMMLPKDSLGSLDSAIKKGQPKYFEAEGNPIPSSRALCIGDN